MKNCPHCGKQIEDNALFCPYCGISIKNNNEQQAGAAPQNDQNGAQADAPKSGHYSRDEQNADANAHGTSQTEPVPAASGSYQSSWKNSAGQQNYNYQNQNQSKPAKTFYYAADKNIALCIVFSIITFGIYELYWLYVLNEALAELTDDREHTGGGLVILFSIITFGIYMWYWTYKAGQKVDIMKGNPNGDSNVLYLILSIFGLAIVAFALIQDNINQVMRNMGLGRNQ
jgi:hypothetical protein